MTRSAFLFFCLSDRESFTGYLLSEMVARGVSTCTQVPKFEPQKDIEN